MLTILTGMLVGLALGLTGGGGSILAVPILVFLLGVPPVEATTISLASVCLMSLVGALEATYTKMTEWRTAVLMSAGGMLAAPLGVKIASGLGEEIILTGFAFLMIGVSMIMGFRAFKVPALASVLRVNFMQLPGVEGPFCQFDKGSVLRLSAPCSIALFIAGIVTGILSGVFGVGGGFLIVPALMYVTKLDIHRAVANSLSIITLTGISGVAAAFLQGRGVDPVVTGLFMAGGVAGMMGGRILGRRIPALALQKVFAVVVLLLGFLSLVL